MEAPAATPFRVTVSTVSLFLCIVFVLSCVLLCASVPYNAVD